jgi:hypothetical protein
VTGRNTQQDAIRLVNLTPHRLVVIAGIDATTPRAPDGPSARIEELRGAPAILNTDLGPLPVVPVTYADRIVNLPDPALGVRYVVSRVTAIAAATRDDVLFPLDEVRDADGAIVGCRSLGCFVPPESPRGDDQGAFHGRESADEAVHPGGS